VVYPGVYNRWYTQGCITMGGTLVGIPLLSTMGGTLVGIFLIISPMGGTLVGMYHSLTHGRHPGGY